MPTSASAPTAASRRSASATTRPPASTPPARSSPTTGNAYASFLLGELNTANVVEDSQVATSGRFSTYAFWVQDDFKVTPQLALNLGLRYDIMKPYTESLRSLVVHESRPAEPGGGRLSRRAAVRGLRRRTAATAARRSRPTTATSARALGAAYSLNESHRAARQLRHHVSAGAARSADAGARATAPACSASRPTPRSRAPTASRPRSTGTTACRRTPKPPFFDPTLNTGFATGRPAGRRRHLRRSRRSAAGRRAIRTGTPACSTR